MRSESYKAWIDAMPIDDVRQKIERLERKLADLHVLERLYEDRNGSGETAAPEPGSVGDAVAEGHAGGEESTDADADEGEGDSAGDAAAETREGGGEESAEVDAGEGKGSGEATGGGEGGGGWTHGEDSPEHG